MKWEKKQNGDWIAQGEKGHFLIWKDGRFWRVLYMVEFGGVVKFRYAAKDLKTAKKTAEENYHWEA